MSCQELNENLHKLLPTELEAWEHRFDEAERVIGREATEALKKLYGYYGKDFLVWLAKLYDPDTGCFYYSDSARDNEGFLPDCESTAQTLNMFRFAGLLSRYERSFVKAFPEETVNKCREYLKSLQSPEDGYFYHPQWGKNIGSSRRGRDFAQSIEIIAEMGGKPIYPTATERLAATVDSGAESRKEMPKYLRSKEDMYEWLEDMRYKCTDQKTGAFNSYSFGHNISSVVQGGQVYSAGLGDFVCDYLDKLQDPETGFWEKGATYNSVSGVIKIGSVYGMIPGRVMKYAEKMIESCIDVILSDEDTLHMCLVFNPHGALSTALNSLVRVNEQFSKRGEPEPYDIPALRRLIYSKFPKMVDVTIEKLERFRNPDGSYSYFQAHCAAITQGTPVAIRCKEGDVNATICATLYIIGGVFGYLGIPVVPLANAADFEVIRGIIESAEPIKKIPNPAPYRVEEDFQNCGLTFRSENRGACFNDITYDPIRPDNKAYKWAVDAGTHSSYAFNGEVLMNPPDVISCFEFECEFLIPVAPTEGDAYTLSLSSKDGREAYVAVIGVESGMVTLSDTGEYGNPIYTNRITTLGRVGEWIRLTILYYPGEHGAKIKIYHNGECIKVSDNYCGSFYASAEPVRYVTYGCFTKVCEEKSVIYFDNIKTELYIDRLFVE